MVNFTVAFFYCFVLCLRSTLVQSQIHLKIETTTKTQIQNKKKWAPLILQTMMFHCNFIVNTATFGHFVESVNNLNYLFIFYVCMLFFFCFHWYVAQLNTDLTIRYLTRVKFRNKLKSVLFRSSLRTNVKFGLFY